MNKRLVLRDKWILILFALPGLLYFLIFKYVPLLGNVIAFQDYNIFKGILHSPWVGFAQFKRMFGFEDFYEVFRNSAKLGFYSLLFGFPAPIILALLLNELKSMAFKRIVQTVVYMPHFLSWVIVGSIFINLLSFEGIINTIASQMGIEKIDYVTQGNTFIAVLISTGIWKEVGWGTILYLAALSGINPNFYEAAMVDGASRWRQMWSITLPLLMPTMVVVLLLSVGHILDANVEQVLIFLNPLVRDVGEVFDTYVYTFGLVGGQYSYTTAIALFKAVVGIVLVFGLNAISRKTTGESLY
ncbi:MULTISPECIES: sugar ABC transporter permease [Bacillales]|uniref:ABC transporter permease n=1 Tax=Bacillales TaxID=1385 RepID=UPI0006A77D88|nr:MULTISPECIES: ABC transporter permease subunit [Bacillales]OBZ09506.1 protein lplB [Bacillus sp. FJAT-26390]